MCCTCSGPDILDPPAAVGASGSADGGSRAQDSAAAAAAAGGTSFPGGRPPKKQKKQMSAAEQVRRMHGQVAKTAGANVSISRFFGNVQSDSEQLLFWKLFDRFTKNGSTQWDSMAATWCFTAAQQHSEGNFSLSYKTAQHLKSFHKQQVSSLARGLNLAAAQTASPAAAAAAGNPAAVAHAAALQAQAAAERAAAAAATAAYAAAQDTAVRGVPSDTPAPVLPPQDAATGNTQPAAPAADTAAARDTGNKRSWWALFRAPPAFQAVEGSSSAVAGGANPNSGSAAAAAGAAAGDSGGDPGSHSAAAAAGSDGRQRQQGSAAAAAGARGAGSSGGAAAATADKQGDPGIGSTAAAAAVAAAAAGGSPRSSSAAAWADVLPGQQQGQQQPGSIGQVAGPRGFDLGGVHFPAGCPIQILTISDKTGPTGKARKISQCQGCKIPLQVPDAAQNNRALRKTLPSEHKLGCKKAKQP